MDEARRGVVEIGVDTIAQGRVMRQVNEAIDEVLRDAVRRPNVTGARTVTLKIQVKPELDKESGVNQPALQADVTTKVPGVALKDHVSIRASDARGFVTTAQQQELPLEQKPDNVAEMPPKQQSEGGD